MSLRPTTNSPSPVADLPTSGYWKTGGPASEADVGGILILLHALVVIATVFGLFIERSNAPSVGSLIVVALATLSHSLVYLLPAGFIERERHQRLLVLLGVAVTTGWLFPLAIESSAEVRVSIAIVLFAPLALQRIPVWIVSSTSAMALVYFAPAQGSYGTDAVLWETEFFVVELSLLSWVAFAILYDSIRNLKRLERLASDAESQRVALTDVSLSLLSAANVNEVFSGVSRMLRDGLEVEHCWMARVDPLRKVATMVAMSDSRDAVLPAVDVGEDSPLSAAIESGQVLHIHESNNRSENVVVITADSGVGTTLVIYCEPARRALTPNRIALLEDVATATVHAMRNVQLLGVTQQKAQTDPLTGLPNRRAFQSNLHREFERAKRHERPLSLLMLDLDFLKSINDQYGHPVGDSVIRTAAETIVEASRGSDFLAARYGGEEFAVILPETNLEGAVVAAQRICDAIAGKELPTVGNFTASIGAACFPVNAMTEADLVDTADAALYEAKRTGRNQVAASLTHTLV